MKVNFSFFIFVICINFSFASGNNAVETTEGLDQNNWIEKLWNPTYRIKNWTTKQGLPQNSVNCIIQSHDGYLWIGTFGGLCKFDGLTFEQVSHPKLAYERIISLFEAKDSSIWIGSENNGIFQYKDGEVIHHNLSTGLPGEGVSSIFQLSDGTIGILIHDRGLVFFKGDSIFYKERGFFKRSTLLEQAVVDQMDDIWLTTSEGVFRLAEVGGSLELVKDSKHDKHGRAISITDNGEVFFADHRGVFKVNRGTLESKKILEIDGSLSSKQFYVKDKDEVWFGVRTNGVIRRKENNWDRWSQLNGLPKGDVSAFFKDQDDNLWVGLNGGGLVKIYQNKVSELRTKEIDLRSRIGLAIHKDYKDNLWIGTNGNGFFKLGGLTGELKELKPGINAPDEGVWSIATDTNGNIWAGTFGYGIFHANTKTNKPFSLLKDWIGESQVILAMYFDSIKNRLLVGNDRGGVFQLKDKIWSEIIPESVNQSRITQFAASPNGEIYATTQGDGVKILGQKSIKTITQEDGLASNSIRSIYFDEDGNIWIGTYGSGLSVSLNGEDTFFNINRSHGLFDDLISTINEDQEGYLWVSCNVGVFRVNRKELLEIVADEREKVKSQVFNQSHGMGDSETNGGFQPASVKLSNGLFLYPTAKGISVFNTNSVSKSKKVNQVVIQSVGYGDTLIRNVNKPIKISPQYRDIVFSFTAPFFDAPELIQFEYQLEGYDEDWRSNGTLRNTNYTRLAPENYVFKVRAINSQGIAGDYHAEVFVTITPYWYEIRWVQLVLIVLLLFFVLIVFRRTQNRALQRTINEQRIALAEKEIGGLTKEVDQSKKELTSYTLEIIEKNNLLKEVSEKLNDAKSEQDFSNIDRQLKYGLKEKNDWLVFKEQFEKVDDEFVRKLKSNYTTLTSGQIRLASLVKLGFSSKQIAEFLNNSPASVDVARSKLRKKLNISKEQDLQDFINNI